MINSWKRTAAGLLLFGISFAYVEAAVVVYLRAIEEPIRRQVDPGRSPGDLFPLITRDQLRAAAPEKVWLLEVEVAREAATIVMLAGAALIATGAGKSWLPAFAVAFGSWDLFFYVFLKILLGWPASLLTWDILFLIPVPWAAPVLAPSIVALTILICGLIGLRRTLRGNWMHWTALGLGGALILLSFMIDSPNLIAGGMPHPFSWPLFGAGEILGIAAFVHSCLKATAGSAREALRAGK